MKRATKKGTATAGRSNVDAAKARRPGPRPSSLDPRPSSGDPRPSQTIETTLTVNGARVTRHVPARQHLIDFLREELGLTGSHVACEHGVCGACTVRVDGRIVRGCLMLAVQAEGRRVDTIEGLSDSGELAELQDAFHRMNALQCGFCTPGMLLAAHDLVVHRPDATREAIREHLSGNYCRCTGYQAIVDAVEAVLAARRKKP